MHSMEPLENLLQITNCPTQLLPSDHSRARKQYKRNIFSMNDIQ